MDDTEAPPANPCVTCGACCVTFRVSFYWAESQAPAGRVPAALTERVSPWLACMRGTGEPTPRCVALEGEVGKRVGCAIYPDRPSPCRELEAGDDRCERARARHGLPPFGTAGRPTASA